MRLLRPRVLVQYRRVGQFEEAAALGHGRRRKNAHNPPQADAEQTIVRSQTGLERANEHHDLKSTNSYDYITTVKLPYLNTSQTAQLSTTSNSMKNSKVANTYLQPIKQSTYQKDDSREECDDYDGSWSYRRTRPAILRFKDVISLID